MAVRCLVFSLAGVLLTTVAHGHTNEQVREAAPLIDLRGGSTALCPNSEQYESSRPDPSGTPTSVSILVVVEDIVGIDDIRQSYEVELNLVVQWHDPRLADQARGGSTAVCALPLGDQVWAPILEIGRVRQLSELDDRLIVVNADGLVSYRRRLHLEISQPLSFSEFPFDQQDLNVTVLPVISALDEVVLEPLGAEIRRPLAIGGWTIGEPEAVVGVESRSELGITQSVYRMTFGARRNAEFFLIKLTLPLTLIVMMSWTVFWLDPRLVGPQIGIAATSMLTVIAHQFAISGLLPRISYLTRSDNFTMFASFLVFLALVEAVSTSFLARIERVDLANRIDTHCRWAFPTAFVIVVSRALWF